MLPRLLHISLFVISLLVLTVQSSQAQAPTDIPPFTTQSASAPDQPIRPNIAQLQPNPVQIQPLNNPTALGEAGLSFRYVQRFGETEAGYVGDSAHFHEVWGMGADGANIWIADAWGNRVLKFDSNGNFLQQIGKASFRDATGTPLDFISDVAVDSNGNIWVADGGANHIVKFDSSGKRQSEIGKAWEAGTANNRFNGIHGLAFDGAGNIYVSDSGQWGDYGNQRIQIFDSTGNYLATIGVTGVSGADNNHLHNPRHIAIYGNQLYIADFSNQRVQIFDISQPGSPHYVATLSDNLHFVYPQSVGVDANTIYVTDDDNNRVFLYNRTTRAYVATLGTGSWDTGDYDFQEPMDIAVDTAGHIYVADQVNKRVQQYDSNRNYLRTYGTTGVSYVTDAAHFYSPSGVAVATDESLYITEERGHRLVKISSSGALQWAIGEAGQGGDDNTHLSFPEDVETDRANQVYVADSGNHRVQIFNGAGVYIATLGGNDQGAGNDQFNKPYGVAVDSSGNIFVADTDNQRVQVFNRNRTFVGTIGVTGVAGSDSSHFHTPRDVAIDIAGNIYVADLDNQRVQIFDKNRNYVRTLGVSGQCGSDFDHLCHPIGVTVDPAGHVFVADGWGWRVQVFDANGAYLTTIGGSTGGKTGQMRQADSLAVDSAGNLSMADTLNNRIQKFAPSVPGWVQRNINGFGHPRTTGITSLASWQGYLYASTPGWDGTGARRLMRSADGKTWNEVIGSSFGSVYNYELSTPVAFAGKLYVGTANFNWNTQQSEGAELWRSDNGLTWASVVAPGFGDPTNSYIGSLATFNNQLYAAVSTYITDTHGFELWRSSTGNPGDWTSVVTNGFGDNKNWSIYAMKVFSNTLYMGTYNDATGGKLWRTQDGVNWTQAYVDGFGNLHNLGVGSLEIFRGNLYAGVRNLIEGGEIWRSPDGSHWARVVSGGLGNPQNGRPYSLTNYGGYLYVAIGNTETGVEVWRSSNGSDWQRIGEAGFGDSNNWYAEPTQGIAIFNGNLYMGTWNEANGGELWMYNDANSSQATPQSGGSLRNDNNGFSLTLPAGAVSTTVSIAFSKVDTPTQALPEDETGLRYFILTAQDANGNEVSQFNQAYTMELSYRDADLQQALIDENTLTCLYLDQAEHQWKSIAPDLDMGANKVTCQADHFTEFALAGGPIPLSQHAFLPMISR